MVSKVRVGVVRGGVSAEYSVSLKTGSAVLNNLSEKYHGIDILLDKKGVWHCCGVPQSPCDIFSHVDVIFNALHGYYGEDGKVQRLFESFGIPYTGSESLGSAIAMNKIMAKRMFENVGLKTPYYTTIERGDDENKVVSLYRKFLQPSVVKPVKAGSSFGVSVVHGFNSFVDAIHDAFLYGDVVLIEEFKDGREASCGVLDAFRGQEQYAFPPIEIIPPSDRAFFDYDSKYSGISQEICPSPNFTSGEKEEIMDMAKRAHRALNLKHYSRSDFIVTQNEVYILEVNTLPGLTQESLVPKATEAVGLSFSNFLDHLITLALARK